jgi:glycosyltransferase involved in cell wall biosynthesis
MSERADPGDRIADPLSPGGAEPVLSVSQGLGEGGESLAPNRITACVIARDEATNLAELLPQLRWANEVLVVIDDTTSDGSAAVAAPLADRVEVRPFQSFSAFRNEALDLARSQWIFFVDADERVSPDLAEEVRAAVAESERLLTGDTSAPEAPVAYWVPRHNIMFGRLIQGGGWAPDYQLRVIRRGCGRYDESRQVHEVLDLDGPAGYLSQRLLHFNYESIRQFLAKQRVYTAMEADALRASGRPRRRALVGAPLREFVRRYGVLGGWMDGPIGLFLSLAMAYYAFQRVRLARRATGLPPLEAPRDS